ISEGTAIVVLKRLADAERDGDRIYAVIKAAAGSSDGKALGLTAPRSEGQVRALDRAYAKAGRSEEHTSELQSLMRISYAVFCLKKKKQRKTYKLQTYMP